MDQFDYVEKLNVIRFQNLLETSVSDPERRVLQTLLIEERAKQALRNARSAAHIDATRSSCDEMTQVNAGCLASPIVTADAPRPAGCGKGEHNWAP
jgi:hypothetical protein